MIFNSFFVFKWMQIIKYSEENARQGNGSVLVYLLQDREAAGGVVTVFPSVPVAGGAVLVPSK